LPILEWLFSDHSLAKSFTVCSPCVIGRSEEADICIDHPSVSRMHAGIECDSKKIYWLKDLDSANGTYCNQKLVDQPIRLEDHDEIQLGTQIFLRFLLSNPDEPTVEFRLDAKAVKEFDHEEALVHEFSVRFEKELHTDRVLILQSIDGELQPIQPPLEKEADNLYKRPYSKSIVEEAVSTKEAILWTFEASAHFAESHSVQEARIISAICIPLLEGSRVFGVIYLDRLDSANPFTTQEFEQARSIGIECAINLLPILVRAETKNTQPRLIGKSKALRKVLDFVSRIAATPANVLILGESGTGKELIAEAIHNQSQRKRKPFIVVNCAAVAESLADAELFGHAKGAYTGADKARPGKFLSANDGTIFLDEIGELPEPIQAKLLRVIESGEIMPVGESNTRKVNVRIVAATNRNLADMVQQGRFRADLYYRLNVLSITMPPLRERIEDIPTLIRHFVEMFRIRSGRGPIQIPEQLLDICRNYQWPGNIRELRNVIERLVILSRGSWLDIDDLPAELHKKTSSLVPSYSCRKTLSDVERDYIQYVLKETDGNKSKASEWLGIDRSTLYAKLKQYSIEE